MTRDFARVVCGVVLAGGVSSWLVLSALPARAQAQGVSAIGSFAAPETITETSPADDNPFDDPAAKEAEPADGNPFGESPKRTTTESTTVRAKELVEKVVPKDRNQPPQRAADVPVACDGSDALTAATEAKIRRALLQPTKMEFIEMPLQDAITYLADYHGIPIEIHNRALEDAGVGSDTPMTAKADGTALGPALRRMLGDFDATYVIRDSVLLITTEDAADAMVELRVYGASELADGINAEQAAALLKGFGDQNLTIVPVQDMLVVRASQRDHEEIASLFAKLKAERARITEQIKAVRSEK